jgi:hypothetical protein
MPARRTRAGTRYWHRGDTVMMWIAFGVFLLMALGGAREHSDRPWAAALTAALPAAFALMAARAALRVGVISDERGLVVRPIVGEAIVDWQDIDGFSQGQITESGVITVSKVAVFADLTDGRRLALPLTRRNEDEITALQEELAWARSHNEERLTHPTPPAITRLGRRQLSE